MLICVRAASITTNCAASWILCTYWDCLWLWRVPWQSFRGDAAKKKKSQAVALMVFLMLKDIIPVFGGSIIFNVHPLAYLLFVFSRASMAFNAHSGYQLPFTIFNLFPSIFQSTRRHDWHHSSNKGSFGSFTNFWDRLMGTDVDFETSFAKASKSE